MHPTYMQMCVHAYEFVCQKCCMDSIYTTHRYMIDDEKDTKIEDLKDKASMTKKQVERLQGQIEKLMQERGISVDEQLNEDLLHIMSEQKGGNT